MQRNDDNAFAVADDNIPREHGDIAAADRHIQVDGVVLDKISRCRRGGVIGREGELRDLGSVAEAAVGHDARDPALEKPGNEDGARGSRRVVFAAIDYEDMPRGALLHTLALGVATILENLQVVEVLASRNVPERVGRPHHSRGIRIDDADARDERVAEAALEEGCGQRRG